MNPTRPFRARIPVTFAGGLTALAALSFAPTVRAGPTVSADLDLGTSVGRDTFAPVPFGGTGGCSGGSTMFGTPSPQCNQYTVTRADPRQLSKLYIVGFRLRAGWRFDIGPIFLVPEIGAGYDVQRYTEGYGAPSSLPRVFGGARGGLSFSLAPPVRLEPGVYGHVGYAHEDGMMGGGAVANDVGFALDLRVLRLLLVGAHVGYEVVTTWASPDPAHTLVLADRWVGYGVHAGVVFW